ncbi:hypothetical protein MRU69_07935 [Kocuria flava]|uniref:hypothetical protein n=1 Tax=Kocuria flava TaxID=446860 RepID=UPI001FF10DCA|nr:hypothetical protein [Kocuria flava]MCJ8504799.1 hypothetical protein [Kocuria flava]
MIKRLIFATGFGVGFVVGSASGRKSYETLKANALRTWQDPKVQEKVSEGTDWVKAEVPVVGEKLADGAKKAAGTVGAKASDASATVKDKVSGGSGEAGGTAASSDYADLRAAEPVTPESPMTPAEPRPAEGEPGH